MKRVVRVRRLVAAALLSASFASAQDYLPPRFTSGPVPRQPPLASTGGFVVLEVQITRTGLVRDVSVLQDAPPYTALVENEVRLWRFRPAESDGELVPSRVLVMGLFRAPVLLQGEPPTPSEKAPPSEEVSYPTSIVTPDYPPQALFEGVVMVEVEVDETGVVTDAVVLQSAAPFDEVALESARQFEFRPAQKEGRAVTSYPLVIFGFRQPVTEPANRPQRR